ncbi:unnamed protein product [Rotaria magnacalcarata]|uniref:G-protein coupled receptors family 1 profile domain-containing protein n=1 Tax=Rotaria magnacalcarata TaxID=392030 RepID=A0A816ZCM5_9BILA|nr:unnamed protein product [Rotaria magnacalcarata]
MPDVQLLVIIQCINIYIVFFAASIGTIGNILHIITFTCLKKYHTIPSSIFLVRASFAEQLTTIGLLFPQSIGYATGHDTRVMACLFCKITSVLYTGGGVFTLVCLYLAAIDRYLQTCRSATKRQWMKMKRALLLLCIFTFLSIGLGLPFGIFRDVIPSIEQCNFINATFTRLSFYFYAIIGIISPVALLVVFGYLTWRNVQQTQQRQTTGQSSNNIAQQVTRMILIKTTAIVISVKPSAVSRPSLSTVDFYLNDIIREATSIDENDCVKQAPIGIEHLTKEIIAQEILLIRRHRDLEQE